VSVGIVGEEGSPGRSSASSDIIAGDRSGLTAGTVLVAGIERRSTASALVDRHCHTGVRIRVPIGPDGSVGLRDSRVGRGRAPPPVPVSGSRAIVPAFAFVSVGPLAVRSLTVGSVRPVVALERSVR